VGKRTNARINSSKQAKSHHNFFLAKLLYRSIRLAKLIGILKQFGLSFTVKIIEDVYQDTQTSIVVTKTKSGANLFGIKNDIIYESMLDDEFREPHFQQIARAVLNSKSNCIDLGANHGSHTLWLSELCTEGKIYAFEPQPRVFQALTLNVLLNNRQNVQLYNLAASDRSGTNIYIEQAKKNLSGVNSGWSRVLFNYEIQSSVTMALDDLKFERVSLIKMDIQGSELLAVRGMLNRLRKDRPYIFFEVEDIHLKIHNTTSKELLSTIMQEDYTILRVENDYPCDHIAIPTEFLGNFVMSIENLGIPLQSVK